MVLSFEPPGEDISFLQEVNRVKIAKQVAKEQEKSVFMMYSLEGLCSQQNCTSKMAFVNHINMLQHTHIKKPVLLNAAAFRFC